MILMAWGWFLRFYSIDRPACCMCGMCSMFYVGCVVGNMMGDGERRAST
jgi:hypothetical protein